MFLESYLVFDQVGSEVVRREFGIESKFIKRLDLPSAYPWEYVYCFSFIAIICGLVSFPRNRVGRCSYS